MQNLGRDCLWWEIVVLSTELIIWATYDKYVIPLCLIIMPTGATPAKSHQYSHHAGIGVSRDHSFGRCGACDYARPHESLQDREL